MAASFVVAHAPYGPMAAERNYIQDNRYDRFKQWSVSKG